jgi:glycosyltransferase involved in cell wall biosynthesis
MRIVHVIPQHLMKMGGLQIFVHNVAKQHVKKGHKVYILTHAYPKDITDFPYSVIVVPRPRGIKYLFGFYKWLSYLYLSNLQERYQFDIWQVNGGYPYGAMFADFFVKNNIPSVLRCSGDDIQISEEFDYGVRRDSFINSQVENNYHKFRKLVAITKTVVGEYKKIDVPANTIELIPNGVDYKRFYNSSILFDVRKRHNIPESAQIILSVGRQHPKKNYSIIPEIIQYLLDKNSEAYWIVIGEGVTSIIEDSIAEEIKNKIILIDEINYDHNKNVEVPTDELINYYKQSDLFAMTSSIETFGIVLIEAMAAGLPIICFDAPGVVDVMDSKYGYICKGRDIAIFKLKLLELLNSDNSLLSRESIKNAENYSWEIISDMYLSLYSKII